MKIFDSKLKIKLIIFKLKSNIIFLGLLNSDRNYLLFKLLLIKQGQVSWL